MGKRQDVSCGETQHMNWGNTEDLSCGEMEVVRCGKTQAGLGRRRRTVRTGRGKILVREGDDERETQKVS